MNDSGKVFIKFLAWPSIILSLVITLVLNLFLR